MAKAAKRARQKDQRRAKIEEEIKQYKAKRRRRLGINFGVLAVVAALVAFFVFKAKQSPNPTATPTPSASAGGVACGGKKPAAAKPKTYTSPPAMTIDNKKTYKATMKTSCGTIVIDLAADKAPQTVNSFVFLAKEGFYNGLVFHRVVSGFAIQGGDPKGDGSGGPGYKVTEAPPAGIKYTKGIVAMAKAGAEPAGTSGSQFFIVPGDGASTLPADYALLGTVTSGSDVLQKIEAVPTAAGGSGEKTTPTKTIYILSVTISES